MNEGQVDKKPIAKKQRHKKYLTLKEKYLALEELDRMLEGARLRGELDQQWWLM